MDSKKKKSRQQMLYDDMYEDARLHHLYLEARKDDFEGHLEKR